MPWPRERWLLAWGYAIWYRVLPALKATNAATLQLSVPVIAAVGGVLLLGEPITPRLLLASVAILGGIALVILAKRRSIPHQHEQCVQGQILAMPLALLMSYLAVPERQGFNALSCKCLNRMLVFLYSFLVMLFIVLNTATEQGNQV